MAEENVVTLEFHVSREARDRYQFDEALFALSGNVVLGNFHAARVFAQKINDKRDLVRFPEQMVRAGHINAMGLIDEILHFVTGLYRDERNRTVMGQALAWLRARFGQEALDATLRRFVDQFPPLAVYKGELDPASYLEGETAGAPHREIALEEMLMLWLANSNSAFSPFLELFDDTSLEKETVYREAIAGLHEFFANQPPFGPDQQNLLDMLRSPAIAVPHSLGGQLSYILEKWGYLLGKHWYRLLGGLDLIKEEERGAFVGGGVARSPVYQFGGQEQELERFSPDRDWMPRLVLLAKNAYVWLDQLSRKYRREIRQLNQVPDEELQMLAGWGFSGIWLIGLWERSRASQKIKQLCGNPEAVASAYSLDDYVIAADLGGEAAFQDLRNRAWKRGIRLASDMVPNHMGIDSRWVMQHPDWFIALEYSPFPSYRFSGPDLSPDSGVGIFLEDHYYSRSDAAVVFKRVDRHTGSEKYIYHGNDGTSMPWNDTAQLDFLRADVREAVIQTILHVARKFSIIRFDAAMTLSRKHYQRLWFPEPGTGGAIPSRAEHGMTRDQLLAHMPNEFWREVVDRVAQEVPDTLLLAEAFWLMEGYFVRTLGMHRVYNSAFMNMLKHEENANYRSVMKNTLEFDPDILKRFVNFMNNPDEETAVAQFGKGDKYFGVCTLMATLPGLPMFGHGQIEGFTEKYGMEYRRAYWDERADADLVRRHEREIFPLLRRRYLFAEVNRFFLYDVFAPEGYVNEDIFAYSNGAGNEHVLVLYHNKFAAARGWVRSSVGYAVKMGSERRLTQTTLGAALNLTPGENHFCIFRDHVTDLEYIRSSKELCDKGLYVELAAFKYHVFLDFREVADNEWHHYAHLTAYLDGRGVPRIDEALKEIFLGPILGPFKELVNARAFRHWQEAVVTYPPAPPPKDLLGSAARGMTQILRAMKQFAGGTGDVAALASATHDQLETALFLPVFDSRYALPATAAFQEAVTFLKSGLAEQARTWGVLFGWTIVHDLGRIINPTDTGGQSRSCMDEWLLGRILSGVFRDLGLDESQTWEAVLLIGLLTSQQRWFDVEGTDALRAYHVLEALLKDLEGQQFLRVNRYQNILWYTGENLDQLLWWLFVVAAIQSGADTLRPTAEVAEEFLDRYRLVTTLQEANRKAEHQVEKLLEAVKEPGNPAPPKPEG
jgi:glycosidase